MCIRDRLDPTVYPVGAEPELYEIELNDTAIDATEEIIKGNICLLYTSPRWSW